MIGGITPGSTRRRSASRWPGTNWAHSPELVAHDLDWDWEPASTFLDALAALVDRERIEAEAPKWLQPGTFSEAFALRALGIARDDRALLRQALARFEAMGLSWHAGQTRRLL